MRRSWLVLVVAAFGAALSLLAVGAQARLAGHQPPDRRMHHPARRVVDRVTTKRPAAPARRTPPPPMRMPMPAATPSSSPPTAAAPPSVPAAAPSGAAAVPSAPVVAPARVQATARDTDSGFALALSRPSVAAGPVKIEFVDGAQDAHALSVRTQAGSVLGTTGAIQPGDRATLSLTLAAGSYVLYCPMPGHEQMGMHAVLTVQ